MQNNPVAKILNSETPHVTTIELASRFGVKATTVHRNLCVKGHFMGLVPVKLPNGRLLWPVGKGGA